MASVIARGTRRPGRGPARAGRREPRTRLDVGERRTQLIELGLEHFGERAYDDVSIDAIAEVPMAMVAHMLPLLVAHFH